MGDIEFAVTDLAALIAVKVVQELKKSGLVLAPAKTPHATESERQLWTVEQAAAFLGMSTSWVYKRISAGEIPHVKLGTVVRFVPEQVQGYVVAPKRPRR